MRRERIRVYTEASGPLYFGRIDGTDGETAVRRPPRRLEPGQRAAVGQLARARRGAVLRRDRARAARRRAAAAPGHRGPHASSASSTRRWRQEDDDHLTEAIVEDITRQRVGEMRQIISTITPDQYELISREADGALVIQGGPGTGKTAVGLHRAAWLLYADPELTRAGVLVVGPERDVHPLHRAGAAGARRGRRRAAADRRR